MNLIEIKHDRNETKNYQLHEKKFVNILITGGCGFIGSNFVKNVLNKNFNVFIVDDYSTGYPSNLQKLRKLSKERFIFITLILKISQN